MNQFLNIRNLVAPFFVLCLSSAFAEEAKPAGDIEVGKSLFQRKCQACHISLVGGDGTELHRRPDRRIKTASDLARQIKGCNHQLNVGLKSIEVRQVTAYMREEFYSKITE